MWTFTDRTSDRRSGDGEEEDYQVKLPKAIKLTDEDVANAQKLQAKLLISQQQFQNDFLKILKQYIKAAITIIVRNRRLCPAEAFLSVRVLGTKVPRFIHPSSLEYVDEVSKKFALFISRNVGEGCVMHVMIEKNKTLHVVQRFVFRIFGSVNGGSDSEPESFQGLDMVRKRCRSSLIDILTCESLKPMSAPQFSRWSVSLGVKKKFIDLDAKVFNNLWSHDPSGCYFPWKKRPKSLASIPPRVACVINFSNEDDQQQKSSCTKTSNQSEEISSTNEAKRDLDDNATNVQISTGLKPTTETISTTPIKNQESLNGVVCFPVSSFLLYGNLIMSIYGLEYPAPPEAMLGAISPAVSKHGRNSSVSVRLSQFKNRLLRQN